MDIEPLIATLDSRYEAEEAALIERMLREYNGAIADTEPIEEIGLLLPSGSAEGFECEVCGWRGSASDPAHG